MNKDTIFHQFKLTVVNNWDSLIEPIELIEKIGTAREIRKINVLNNDIKNNYNIRINHEIRKYLEPFFDYGFTNVSSSDIHFFYKSEDYLFNKFEKNNLREMFLNVPLFALECIISGDKFLLDKEEFCEFVKNNDIPDSVFNKNIPVKIPLEVPDEIHIFCLKDNDTEPKINLAKKFAHNVGIKVVRTCMENFQYNLHKIAKTSHRPICYFGENAHYRELKLNLSKLPIISAKYNSTNKFIDFYWPDFNEFIVQFEQENRTIM